MRFFIQGCDVNPILELTGYEYFKLKETTKAEKELARPYSKPIDFAYFAACLGWSISDYEDSTPVQRAFIRKEIERQTVQKSELLKSAVQAAVNNVLNKKKVALWTKPNIKNQTFPNLK